MMAGTNGDALVVEDGPTLTHGGMTFGAGVVAARRFGAVQAVEGVAFDVRRGEMFGLIGPDGAGNLALETAGGEQRMLFKNGGPAPK